MPPKKKDAKSEKGQLKALEKEKQKIVEDKTFGLKNKNKSKAVQKYIKGVQAAVQGPKKGGDSFAIDQKKQQTELKKKELQQQQLLASLFKGTENIKKVSVEVGSYDPKQSKAEQKIDLYTDQREQKQDGMGNWTAENIEEVIALRQGVGAEDNATAITCKYFLDAVEKKQYGWFWVCPNGGDACKYRHCLPQGYVLKSDGPKDALEEEEAIEVIVERERAALPSGGTPVTAETFLKWKKKKEEERIAAVEALRAQEASKKGNRGLNILSGRDLFTFDPTLFVDDEGAAGEADYEEDEAAWEEIINKNQETIDQANSMALAENGGDEEGDDLEKREDDSVQPIRESLFMNDDLPDDLDELDELDE